jgi:hypothetical protein
MVTRTIGMAWRARARGACDLPKGATSDGGAPGDGGAFDAGATVVGAACGKDPDTGVTLCSAVSVCPRIVVDPDLFPGCGFRVHGDVLDLECACFGALCPIGVAATCTQVEQLLGAQTQSSVCAQVNEGRCTQPVGTGAESTCDKSCASQCGGDPSCIQYCGC